MNKRLPGNAYANSANSKFIECMEIEVHEKLIHSRNSFVNIINIK